MNLAALAAEKTVSAHVLACRLPRDPMFQRWIQEHWNISHIDGDIAVHALRVMCKIESRRELATDPEAAARFEQFIRRPFVAWRDQQQQRQGAEA